MLKWLSRFAFTLIILGALQFYLLYEWKINQRHLESWQIPLFVIGGALCLALGAHGIKARHRRV